jgi:hypothetical protein
MREVMGAAEGMKEDKSSDFLRRLEDRGPSDGNRAAHDQESQQSTHTMTT